MINLKENKEITLSKFRIIYPENSDRTLRDNLENIGIFNHNDRNGNKSHI